MSSTVIRTSPSNFQSIFDAALSDYAKQTQIDLTTHSFIQTLQTCDSADAIIALFQDKANQFQEYRDGNRKLINCLEPVVQFLHTVTSILAEAATLVPFQPTKAVLVGVDVLLTASIGVSASYEALVDLFKRVGSFLNRLRIYNEITLSPLMFDMVINIMVEVLSVLSLATKEIKRGRLGKSMRKLFGERKIEDVLQRLDRLTLDEERMAGTETLQVVHHLKNDMKLIVGDGTTSEHDTRQPPIPMQEATRKMVKMERLHFLREIRSWLSPPDPSTNHNIARASHHDGTTDWIFHSPFFKKWNASGSLLWIHGNAGSGKSIICSSIIQQVKTNCDRGIALMGYYYFTFNEITKQGIRGLLTSLLSQFCAKSDPCYEILTDLYSENDAGLQQPDNKALAESLKEILRLSQVPMRYIILDGVDECPNTSGLPTAREEVLEFLKELVSLNLSNLRICVTSRPEVDIRTALEHLTPLLVPLQDQIGQKQAILDYIRNVVCSDPRMERCIRQNLP